MSPHTAVSQAVTDTVLAFLAPFFLAATGGDLDMARQAAAGLLANYKAQTDEELRLAAEVVNFGFQSLRSLAESNEAGLAFSRVARLRGIAISLARAKHQAQHKLDQLQRARRAPPQVRPDARPDAGPVARPEPASLVPATARPDNDQARLEQVMDLPLTAHDTIQNTAPPPAPAQPEPRKWSREARQQKMLARMAENNRRKREEHERQHAALAAAVTAPGQGMISATA